MNMLATTIYAWGGGPSMGNYNKNDLKIAKDEAMENQTHKSTHNQMVTCNEQKKPQKVKI